LFIVGDIASYGLFLFNCVFLLIFWSYIIPHIGVWERFVPYPVEIMRMSRKSELDEQIRDPAWMKEFLSWIPRGLPHPRKSIFESKQKSDRITR
jgi:hypothetical protein